MGGREDWTISIEELADIVLDAVAGSAALVRYCGEESFTTRTKVVDFSRARRDLGHDPEIDIREGVHRYVAWARKVYNVPQS